MRYLRYLTLAVAVVVSCGILTACNDVKTVEQRETVHESEPQMVAPGEMIVE